jgi:hypothetical protein
MKMKFLLFPAVLSFALAGCTSLPTPEIDGDPDPISIDLQGAALQSTDVKNLGWRVYNTLLDKLNQRDGFKNKVEIPNSFYIALEPVIVAAALQQPKLLERKFWLSDWRQIVTVNATNGVSKQKVVQFIISTEFDKNKYDWVAKIAVDLDKWKIKDWVVNKSYGGSFKPLLDTAYPLSPGVFSNYLRWVAPSLEDGQIYNKGELYVAALGEEPSQTRLFSQSGKVYSIGTGSSGSLELRQVGIK